MYVYWWYSSDEEFKFIKIGYGIDPWDRMQSYSTRWGLPRDERSLKKLRVPHGIESFDVEQALHTRMHNAGHKRLRIGRDNYAYGTTNEVFKLNGKSRTEIDQFLMRCFREFIEFKRASLLSRPQSKPQPPPSRQPTQPLLRFATSTRFLGIVAISMACAGALAFAFRDTSSTRSLFSTTSVNKAAPATDANPMSAALTDATSIRELQTLLKEVGYDPGQIDGFDGPATRKAIRDYLRAHGLPDTDVPSTALLLRLRTGKSHVPR